MGAAVLAAFIIFPLGEVKLLELFMSNFEVSFVVEAFSAERLIGLSASDLLDVVAASHSE